MVRVRVEDGAGLDDEVGGSALAAGAEGMVVEGAVKGKEGW
jgi:hypothetical protein